MHVRKRIFISNTIMVLVTLLLFFMVNMALFKVYSEASEKRLRAVISASEGNAAEDNTAEGNAAAESVTAVEGNGTGDPTEVDLEALVKEVVSDRKGMTFLLLADGLSCIAVLVLISLAFTRHLTRQILTPLEALEDGADRIGQGNYKEAVVCQGDLEFQRLCTAFNSMQASLLTEKEKNAKYEKARIDMIAGISHDLRTPLTAVRGTVKGLLDGIVEDPEKQRQFLQVAYRRTGEMDNLLQKLFFFSRMETGNMPLNFETLELKAFVESYVSAAMIAEPGLQIQVQSEVDRAWISADPEQLLRIFDNLVSNSLKYAGTDTPRITVSLKTQEKRVRIVFADNGVGVPQDVLPHIFEEFYRADQSRNQKKGSGLGLYVVRFLVERMHGSIRAESGEGLRVTMEFPEADRTGVGEERRNG